MHPHHPDHHQPHRPHSSDSTPPNPPNPTPHPISPPPTSLIIALFALRLTHRLIHLLPSYPTRATDLHWLTTFLAPYPHEYALAIISGPRRDDYLAGYQGVVGRMKSQARFPVCFMGMKRDVDIDVDVDGGEGIGVRGNGGGEQERGMSDAHRLRIIDFSDAAREWGSTVPIPAHEAERMIELANQRRVAGV